VKVEPGAGVAVRVTGGLSGKLAWQVLPQVIPAGSEVTVPLPTLLTLRGKVGTLRLKVAVTVRSWVICTTQAPVPVQSPLHPVKVEPGAGVAVRVTGRLSGKLAWQVLPQVIPAGSEVTVPLPLPVGLTLRGKTAVPALTTTKSSARSGLLP
jgi:3D (Asp-Asp-Asp) domain-containing protein